MSNGDDTQAPRHGDPMWQCPRCGEQIGEVFDACWKCGMARDGAVTPHFQPEPSDPDSPGWEADPAPVDEPTGASTPLLDHLDDRLVELCSAGNAPEAHALQALLEAEGIDSRVVGDVLGNAAGALPLGEPIAPRLWLWADDRNRARAILDERRSQPQPLWGESVEGSAQSEADEDTHSPTVHLQLLGGGCLMAGVACMLLGAVWAACNAAALGKYQATAEGTLAGYVPHYVSYVPPTRAFPLPATHPTISVRYDLYYEFVADGKTYHSVVHDDHLGDWTVVIHYDPRHPEENMAGPIARPLGVLGVSLAIGATLALMGYRFRNAGNARSMPLAS